MLAGLRCVGQRLVRAGRRCFGAPQVEPERVRADLKHVPIGEDSLGLHPLVVDVGAVKAAIHQHEALGRPEDVRVGA